MNIFLISAATAQKVGLDAPSIKMDAPAVNTDMPGQGGMSQDRDKLLMQKNIKDIDSAQSELAAMSEWEAPATLSSKEKKEWRQQSQRFKQQAETLANLADKLQQVIHRADSGGKADYEQARAEARDTLGSLQSNAGSYNVNGDAAAKRQRAAVSTLNSVSLL